MCYEIVFIENIIYTNNHVIYVGRADSKDTIFIQISGDNASHLVLFSFRSYINFRGIIKRFIDVSVGKYRLFISILYINECGFFFLNTVLYASHI